MTARALFNFMVPVGLAALAVLFLLDIDLVSGWAPGTRAVLPWLAWVAGMGLGVLFHRNRLVYAVAALALAERLLAWFCSGGAPMTGLALTVFQATAVLLPLNLGLFALLRERGLLSSRSVWVLAFLLAQPAAVGMMVKFHVPPFNGPEGVPLVWGFGDPDVPFPLPAWAALAAGGAASLLGYARRRESIEAGLFWAIVLAGWAQYRGTVDLLTPLYMASAGLVLVLSLLNLTYRLAFQDDLTGLPARRAFNETGRKLGACTLAMVDIDHFKKVNDRHGHDVGDQVLRMVAGCLAQVKGGGRAFRYGGEEFAILFSGKTLQQAHPHLEALRKDIDEAHFVLRGRNRPRKKPDDPKPRRTPGRRLKITVSIGAAEREGREMSLEALVKKADQALYRAKRAGRNRLQPPLPKRTARRSRAR